MLVLFGWGTLLREFVSKCQTVYIQLEYKQLPLSTELSLAAGEYLWAGILIASIATAWTVWRRDRLTATQWCAWTVLVTLGITAAIVCGLYFPALQTSGGGLSR
jgi:hypothetical protein